MGAAKIAEFEWAAQLITANGTEEIRKFGPGTTSSFSYSPNLATNEQEQVRANYMVRAKIGPRNTNFVYLGSPAFLRCDNQMGKSKGQGCVAAGHAELHLNFNNRPYYSHVRAAIKSGLPSRLTRDTDPKTAKKRRNVVCPLGPKLPRPDGYECDEYPFASTKQGGQLPVRTQAGLNCQMDVPSTTGSKGTSRCFIPTESNRAGGNELNSMYLKQRVLNGDEFVVLDRGDFDVPYR